MAKKRMKSTAKRIAWAAAYVLFTPFGLFRRGLFKPRKPLKLADVRSILAIRLDLMGDLVFTLPALRALKEAAPSARLTVLVQPYAADLVRNLPFVDRVITADVARWRKPGVLIRSAWRDVLKARRELLEEQFDLCVSFYGKVGASAALLSNARYLVGYSTEGYPGSFGLGLQGYRYQHRRHEAEYCLDLVRPLLSHNSDTCCEDYYQDSHNSSPALSCGPELPVLVVDPAARSKVDQLLVVAGISSEDRLVALHPGALNMAAKRWLPERWAAVADWLQKELGQRVVLIGSASEVPLTEEVRSTMSTSVVNMAGKTSVAELVALLSRCRLFLGGDSGPLHVASALGVPSVSVYGPTDPAITGPLSARARVLVGGADCAPCYDLKSPPECRRGNLLCMDLVSVEQVYEAAREMVIGEDVGERGNS
ncbi:MAG: glycosyltransferase family 9 protein [Chloroflexota bacterium]|jgi:lipopolysaccharide heptosyltransferase II